MFGEIERVLDARLAELQASSTGIMPEQVLVLETVGSLRDFIKAVQSIPGLEWLAEWEEEDIPPDDDFFFQDEAHKAKPLGGRAFLILTNQHAMRELLGMWRRYERDQLAHLGKHTAKWRELFRHLRKIRPWDVQDRLLETGVLQDWEARVAAGEEQIRFEAELWYRENDNRRARTLAGFRDRLSGEGGALISQTVIREIGYHGILAELPIQSIKAILAHPETRLVRSDEVMFFRAIGQAAVPAPEDQSVPGPKTPIEAAHPDGSPIVALLDGLPLENHEWLAERLVVDDPDGWSAEYPAADRHHGTAMASLILYGELIAGAQPLPRPIYIRPILRPDPRDWRRPRPESVPQDLLPVDIVHRAVRRLFEGEGTTPPVAPSVSIINLSVGDWCRPFAHAMSPWARLVDWLAYHYNVLFIVSAGNHSSDIELDVPRSLLARLSPEDLEIETIRAIAREVRHRRLLTPAESINALTIGAVHADGSTPTYFGHRRDLLQTSGLPSPVNAIGLGHRRSVKPEILLPGGRQLYQEKLGTIQRATFIANQASLPPGQSVAAPGVQSGGLSDIRYTRGTSNATALATRTAAQLYDLLRELRDQPGGDLLDDQYTPVLLKTLLVHGARWGNAYAVLESVLRTPDNRRQFREYASRFLGYGSVDPQQAGICTDQRATLLGCGTLGDEGAHQYAFPLPPSLSGQKTWRRLTMTLAWLTPIHCSHRAYRCAHLWFAPDSDPLQVERREADWRAVQRGTVQHEILEGNRATPFVEGDSLQVKVNCRADAGEFPEGARYALAVTLEVAEEEQLPIYEEIRTRIRPTITITPVTGSNG